MPRHLVALAKRMAALEQDLAPPLTPEQYQEQLNERMWADVKRKRAERRRTWRPEITTAQLDELAAALAAGRLVLNLRTDHSPTWYDFCPPPPYPAGCWETPWYRAGEAATRVLTTYACTFFDNWVSDLPTDADGVLQWLRACVAWFEAAEQGEPSANSANT